jgi:hypothetical protein
MGSKLYLLNAPIMPNEGIYAFEIVDKQKFVETFNELRNEGYEVVSAIGHEATAKLLTDILNYDVPVNRIAIEFQEKDVALVIKLKQRLEEGKVLNREELQDLINAGMVEFGVISYIPITVK